MHKNKNQCKNTTFRIKKKQYKGKLQLMSSDYEKSRGNLSDEKNLPKFIWLE